MTELSRYFQFTAKCKYLLESHLYYGAHYDASLRRNYDERNYDATTTQLRLTVVRRSTTTPTTTMIVRYDVVTVNRTSSVVYGGNRLRLVEAILLELVIYPCTYIG